MTAQKVSLVPTIRDVAREAGVSVTTVSHALSGRRPVSGKTRERIERAINRLGYRPNAIAAAMSRRRTQTLGMIVPDLTNPFYGELLGIVERTAAGYGYSLIVTSSELDTHLETRAIMALRDHRVDALLFLSNSSEANPALHHLIETDTPLVCLDEDMDYLPEGSSVLTADNEAGGALAAKHLVELGHRELGVVGGPIGLPTGRSKLDGFCSTAAKAGVEVAPKRIRHAGAYTFQAGQAAARSLLLAEPTMTGLFCGSDLIALGACAAARELGRQVPDELSIVGFDDIFVAELVTPTLTTIRTPNARLGKEATEIAIELSEGKRTAPVRLNLPVELVVRESTGPPPSDHLA